MISGLDDRSGRPDADKSLRGMLSSRGSRVRFAFLSHLRPTRIEAMSLSTGSCSDATAGGTGAIPAGRVGVPNRDRIGKVLWLDDPVTDTAFLALVEIRATTEA